MLGYRSALPVGAEQRLRPTGRVPQNSRAGLDYRLALPLASLG